MLSAIPNIPGHAHELVALLMDAGSQTSFIDEKTAFQFDLKTIDSNINVTLKGFNRNRRYVTRTVLFPLLINSKEYTISCLCIPEISVQFSTPHLQTLVQLIDRNNEKLAFKPFYSAKQENVGNIKCILGSSDWNVVFDLPRKLIGDPNLKQSACYLSNQELIPVGSIELFLKNYEFEMKHGSVEITSNIVSVEMDDSTLSSYIVHSEFEQKNFKSLDSSLLTSQIEYDDSDIDDILDIASYSELNETCNRICIFRLNY